jgi:hypothetical protein
MDSTSNLFAAEEADMHEVTPASARCNGGVRDLIQRRSRNSTAGRPIDLRRVRAKQPVAPATSCFGRLSITTNECQTITETHGFVEGQI